MSFILDALKKSESDRQRQSGPSLFEVKVAPPRRRLPIWAAAIAVLLGINAIVVSWMLLRHAPTRPPAASSPAAAAAPSPTAGRSVESSAPGNTAPAPLVSQTAPAVGSAAARASVPPVTAPAPASAAQPGAGALAGDTDPSAGPPASGDGPDETAAATQPATSDTPGASAGSDGSLPLYQQVVGSDGLPQLHLDLHVFAKAPKDRFVMINMHRLGEGDSLPDGVRVDAIRPDGVALSYHGTRFLLPRD